MKFFFTNVLRLALIVSILQCKTNKIEDGKILNAEKTNYISKIEKISFESDWVVIKYLDYKANPKTFRFTWSFFYERLEEKMESLQYKNIEAKLLEPSQGQIAQLDDTLKESLVIYQNNKNLFSLFKSKIGSIKDNLPKMRKMNEKQRKELYFKLVQRFLLELIESGQLKNIQVGEGTNNALSDEEANLLSFVISNHYKEYDFSSFPYESIPNAETMVELA